MLATFILALCTRGDRTITEIHTILFAVVALSAATLTFAADTDGDGVDDTEDNCLAVANAADPVTQTQCDTDGDGIGNHCDADLDNNCIVNSFDLAIMRANFGSVGANNADLDCNGTVNSFDLSIMRQAFGAAPGPNHTCACPPSQTSNPLDSGLIPIPADLGSGDEFQIIFHTSGQRDGTSANVADYDAFVQAHANAAGIGCDIGLSWKAMVSTAAVNAADHAVVSAPVYNFRGHAYGGPQLLAAGRDELWEQGVPPDALRTWDEHGHEFTEHPDANFVGDHWTGSNADGTVVTDGKEMGGPSGDAWCGNPRSVNFQWFHFFPPSQTTPLYVLALSPVLTVP